MNIKDSKGSITLFVLIGLLFMSSFLIISYGKNVNKSKIAQEQYNIIRDTYSYYDGDGSAYNRAYADLRSKNKATLTATATSSYILELTNSYGGEYIRDYTIYGNSSGLGEYDSSYGKYKIQIYITGKNGEAKTENIYLSSKLYKNEYINYKTQCVFNSNGTGKEIISLPTIYTYDDYTKIQVTSGGTPSKMVVEYIGYNID